jgi:hypothetical protein
MVNPSYYGDNLRSLLKAPEPLAEFGVVPEDATWTVAGLPTNFNWSKGNTREEAWVLGDVDVYSRHQFGKLYTFDVTSFIKNTTMIREAIELAAGVGTPEQSQTFAQTKRYNASTPETMYRFFQGCIPERFAFTFEGILKGTWTWAPSYITKWLTETEYDALVGVAPVFTGSGLPTGTAWTATQTGMLNPLTVNSVGIPMNAFNFEVAWTRMQMKAQNDEAPRYQRVGKRVVTGSITTWDTDLTLEDLVDSGASVPIVCKLHGSPSADVTIAGAFFTGKEGGEEAGREEFDTYTYNWEAESITVTDVA